MKDTHVLCTAGIIALLAIVAVFIGYATDTLPQSKQRVITISLPAKAARISNIPVEKKRNCHCCQEGLKKLRDHLEKLREQEQAAKKNGNTPE